MKELTACFERERQTVRAEKKPADAGSLRGTYEELFSNRHGKMQIAAKTQDRHLAFMSLSGLDEMLSDIRSAIDVSPPDAVSVYCPEDLEKTAGGFDALLRAYLQEYDRAGMRAASLSGYKRFPCGVSEAAGSLKQSSGAFRPARETIGTDKKAGLWRPPIYMSYALFHRFCFSA